MFHYLISSCGKTTTCEMFAAVHRKRLHAVNCHLHTETSDFLGGLRPVRREKNGNEVLCVSKKIFAVGTC